MYQWRKFEFFEEKYAAKCTIPKDDDDDITVNRNNDEKEKEREIECCSSGRGKVVTGFDDGSVCFFDRGFKFNYAFRPHSSVLFLQQLKVLSIFPSFNLLFWGIGHIDSVIICMLVLLEFVGILASFVFLMCLIA